MPVLALGDDMNLTIEVNGQRYDLDYLPLGSIREAGRYQFIWDEEREDASPGDFRLVVSDITLQPSFFLSFGKRTEIRWLWEPEFFSGTFYPVLYFRGERIWPKGKPGGIVVNADEKKLTQKQFQQMVDDITAVAQIAFSLSPAFSQASLGKGKKFSLAQMELILLYLEEIIQTVEAIARNPKKKLYQFRREVPLYQAKQSDETAVLKLVTNPAGFIKLESENTPAALKQVADKTKGILFDKISEVDNRISYNTYENAFVKSFLVRLLATTRQLEQQLQTLTRDDEGQAQIAQVRIERLKTHKRFIQKALELPFLQEVLPLPVVDRYTVTMAKHPDYRRLYQYYLKFLRTVTPLGQDSLNVSLDRTYQLYEYWCFMKIAGYLMEKFSDNSVDAKDLFTVTPERGGISLRLKHGEQSAVRISKNLSIYFQRHYGFIGEGTTGSYSFLMIPDMVIEQKNDDGSKTVVVLDPKYRVGDNAIKSALGDMHKYKDAIIDQDGNRVIQAAFILVPKEPESEDIRRRYLNDQYRNKHGFGVVVLTPGQDDHLEHLVEMLRQTVGLRLQEVYR